MRNRILVIILAAVLVLVNYGIWQRERLISHGRSVLLELAPVDPRSLMQGDYMALRFKVADEARSHDSSKALKDGRLVLAVDERNVGTFSRYADKTPVAANEAFMRYRVRNDQFKVATNAFFFQERQGNLYRGARYGEVRLSSDGEALLVSLRGADFQKLGPKDAVGR